jgi:hypothetical protein
MSGRDLDEAIEAIQNIGNFLDESPEQFCKEVKHWSVIPFHPLSNPPIWSHFFW